MTGQLREMFPLAGGEWLVSFTTPTDPRELFDKLKGKPISIEIKKSSKKRSLSQNAFLWALCSDIGKALTPPLSKDDVYRRAIKAVGVWWEKEVPYFHIETIKRRWESAGVGWFMEVVDNGKPGRNIIRLYFGTSTYTVDELKVLIEWLVDEAEQLSIPVPVGKERNDLYHEWGLY